jgi:hypothetical protein
VALDRRGLAARLAAVPTTAPLAAQLHASHLPLLEIDVYWLATAGVDVAAPLAELAAAPHVDWRLAELDECAGDMLDALEESYQYLTDRGFSRGRTKEVRM